MRFLFFIFPLLSLILFSSPGFTDKFSSEEKNPLVTYVKGRVELLRGKKKIQLKPGMELFSRDRIYTFKEAEADIKIEKKSAFRLKEESRAEIVFDSKKYRMKLSLGTLLANFITSLKERFWVDTPTAIVGVRGTAFLIEVLTTQAIQVGVLRGEVEVKSKERPEWKVILPPLHRTSLSSGNPPLSPQRLLDEEVEKLKEVDSLNFQVILGRVRRITSVAEMRNLEVALASWWLEKGSFPPSLEALVKAGYIGGGALKDMWGTPYLYQVKGDRYQIISAGEDRVYFTSDDLIYER